MMCVREKRAFSLSRSPTRHPSTDVICARVFCVVAGGHDDPRGRHVRSSRRVRLSTRHHTNIMFLLNKPICLFFERIL